MAVREEAAKGKTQFCIVKFRMIPRFSRGSFFVQGKLNHGKFLGRQVEILSFKFKNKCLGELMQL
jgi:hypothetical protein